VTFSWVLIPARRFEDAKQRLAPVLDAARRAAFAAECLTHVIGAVRASGVAERIAVATDGESTARFAGDLGARVIRDPRDAEGLAAVVDHGFEVLGPGPLAVVMADLPRLRPEEVRGLAAAFARAQLAIAPDHARRGTNALAVRAPFRTCFGHADSFERHVRAAEAARLAIAVTEAPGLAEDVDFPDDYQPPLHRTGFSGRLHRT
jgi:2-phospho-L-lactate guanylyltransferase